MELQAKAHQKNERKLTSAELDYVSGGLIGLLVVAAAAGAAAACSGRETRKNSLADAAWKAGLV